MPRFFPSPFTVEATFQDAPRRQKRPSTVNRKRSQSMVGRYQGRRAAPDHWCVCTINSTGRASRFTPRNQSLEKRAKVSASRQTAQKRSRFSRFKRPSAPRYQRRTAYHAATSAGTTSPGPQLKTEIIISTRSSDSSRASRSRTRSFPSVSYTRGAGAAALGWQAGDVSAPGVTAALCSSSILM